MQSPPARCQLFRRLDRTNAFRIDGSLQAMLEAARKQRSNRFERCVKVVRLKSEELAIVMPAAHLSIIHGQYFRFNVFTQMSFVFSFDVSDTDTPISCYSSIEAWTKRLNFQLPN